MLGNGNLLDCPVTMISVEENGMASAKCSVKLFGRIILEHFSGVRRIYGG